MAYYSNMPKPLRGFYRRRRLKKIAFGGGLAGGAYFGRRAIGRGILAGTRRLGSSLARRGTFMGHFAKPAEAFAGRGGMIARGLGRIARVGSWLSKL